MLGNWLVLRSTGRIWGSFAWDASMPCLSVTTVSLPAETGHKDQQFWRHGVEKWDE